MEHACAVEVEPNCRKGEPTEHILNVSDMLLQPQPQFSIIIFFIRLVCLRFLNFFSHLGRAGHRNATALSRPRPSLCDKNLRPRTGSPNTMIQTPKHIFTFQLLSSNFFLKSRYINVIMAVKRHLH